MAGDPANLEVCNCSIAKPVVESIDLTGDTTVVSSDESSTTVSNNWLSTPLYTLHVDKKRGFFSSDGWLSDTVIKAAQLLILQEFPHIAGLQDNMEDHRRALKELRDLEDEVIPTAKGNATVVMKRSDYDKKMRGMLNDTTTYRKLQKGHPGSQYRSQTARAVQQRGNDEEHLQ